MKPYNATERVFMQQFGNRTVLDHKGVEHPVRVFYNLDDNGKHPVTGEDVPVEFTAPGQVLIAGPAESIIEASGVLYGFSVGLGGYVVLNEAGEFPGIQSRNDGVPGSIPLLTDVLKVVTNWYPTTPVAKQGISISFTKADGMIVPDTQLVLSRNIDISDTVVLVSRQTISADSIDYVPELFLLKLNTNDPSESYSTIIDSAFEVVNNNLETTAVYYLYSVYRELRLIAKPEGFEFLLVKSVKAQNQMHQAINRFESVTTLATCDLHFNFDFNPEIEGCGHSMFGLTLQLETLLTERGYTRKDITE